MDNKPLDLTIELLKSILPNIDWLLENMEVNQGWFNLSLDLADNIIAWEIPIWSTYYLDEKKLRALGMLTLYDVEELKAVTPDNYEEFVEKAKMQSLEIFSEIDDIEIPSPAEVTEFLETAEEDEREQFTKQMIIGVYSFLTMTFNYLSLMTFGRTLCQLVALAQEDTPESDKFLCQAIQIDRTILHLPFVQDRILKAQLGNDRYFLEQLGNHIKRPILSGKIRYRKLWLTFAMLEDEGFLELPREKLLDLLEELGVYGQQFGVEDVGHLTNRLHEYRKKSSLGKKVF